MLNLRLNFQCDSDSTNLTGPNKFRIKGPPGRKPPSRRTASKKSEPDIKKKNDVSESSGRMCDSGSWKSEEVSQLQPSTGNMKASDFDQVVFFD